MKAVLINGYGGPEVLSFAALPAPEPNEDEWLVRIAAIGVNPADVKWRLGQFAGFAPLTFPHVLGYDVAGTVEETGTRVAAMLDPLRHGAYAQFAAVARASMATVPDNLPLDVAAAVPTPGLTGLQLIEEQFDAQPGQRVLVTGAAGMVGRFAIHAARRRGCDVIAAVRVDRREEALAFGAHHVVVLGQEPWKGAAVDFVADTVGGADVAELCAQLRTVRAIVTVATVPIPSDDLAIKPQFFAVRPSAEGLTRLLSSVAAGEVTVPISATLPLHDAARAHEFVEHCDFKGKVILKPW